MNLFSLSQSRSQIVRRPEANLVWYSLFCLPECAKEHIELLASREKCFEFSAVVSE